MFSDALVERFLAAQHIGQRTKEAYGIDVRMFQKWCEANSVWLAQMTVTDVAGFVVDQNRRKLRPTTLTRRLVSLNRFFLWLVDVGELPSAPDISGLIPKRSTVARARDTLTLDELRRMWASTATARDRAIIGLLAFNSLTTEEICKADIDDLIRPDGFPALRLPSRQRQHAYALTPLSVEVNGAVNECADGRRSGPVILAAGGGPINPTAVRRTTLRVGIAAGIQFRVLPLTLTFTLRSIAMDEGFSFLAVMRACGASDSRRHVRLVANSTKPITENAAVRLARLVVGPLDRTIDYLGQAETIANETDAPDAAAVLLAGAAFERHLRALVSRHQIPVNKPQDKRTLGTYIAALSSKRVFTKAEVQVANAIAHHRDNAAHGWFERLSAADLKFVLAESRLLIDRHPIGP